jgi:sugar phosphate isomerase/epimerase
MDASLPQNLRRPRRSFLASAGLAGISALAGGSLLRQASAQTSPPRNRFCAFVKFLQELAPDKLAETIARLGYDGIEATVRPNGQVLPERVEEDLPPLVEALRKRNLEITVMTTNVDRADHPLHENVLRTAAALGVKRYRMGYFKYDPSRPVLPQIEALKPRVRELAALNRELGLQAVYQNHAGTAYVGAGLWDLQRLLEDIPVEQVAVAYDIRHATVEGGTTWPITWNLIQPHLGMVYVKDFEWTESRPRNVPLARGRVDAKFFKLIRQSGYAGPISVHVEYLHDDGLRKNIDALETDLKTLRRLLG